MSTPAVVTETLTLSQSLRRITLEHVSVIVRIAYSLSFALPLFNPAFQGTTLYFYVWLPFCDLPFLRWLVNQRLRCKQSFELLLIGGLFLLAMHSLEVIVRACLILLQLVYLVFLLQRSNIHRYLRASLYAHVLIALLQVIFFFSPGGVPELLTPTGLSRAIWGETFAPTTFTNFGYELFLPRVSGLHREAGFLSSYVISLYLLFAATGHLRQWKLTKVALTVGILLSFSKITFAIVPILLVRRYEKFFDRFPLWLTSIGILAVGALASQFLFMAVNSGLLPLSQGTTISAVHRFFSYHVFQSLDPLTLAFGINTPFAPFLDPQLQSLSNYLYASIDGLREYNLFSGFAGMLIKGGAIAFALFILLLTRLGVRSSELLIVFLITFSVGPDTLQNFVIVAWAYVVLRTRAKHMENLKAGEKTPAVGGPVNAQ